MGMTIDESISIFEAKGKYSLTEKENEAKEVAVDTMNKYQKIEQLVKFYKNAGEIPIFVLEGVLKDGNND